MSNSKPSPSPFPELPPNTPSAILQTPLPTPAHGPGGSFTIACSTTISATPAACITAVLKPSTWTQWNTFIPRATITEYPSSSPSIPAGLDLRSDVETEEVLVPGTLVAFDVHMNLDEKVTNNPSILVSRLEELDGEKKGFRVAWTAEGFPSFLLRSERVQEFVEVEGDEGGVACEYFCWETFYGLLAPVVRLSVGGKLVPAFGAWMSGLKKFAEGETAGGVAE